MEGGCGFMKPSLGGVSGGGGGLWFGGLGAGRIHGRGCGELRSSDFGGLGVGVEGGAELLGSFHFGSPGGGGRFGGLRALAFRGWGDWGGGLGSALRSHSGAGGERRDLRRGGGEGVSARPRRPLCAVQPRGCGKGRAHKLCS